MNMDKFLIFFSLTYVYKRRLNKTVASVQMMAWGQTGDYPLMESVMDYCIDSYMCHTASMG